MKTGTLAICDLEQGYASRLMEYISDKNGMPFKTVAFTDTTQLCSYSVTNPIDMLLISDTAMEQSVSKQEIGKIIILSSGDICSEYKEYPSVYKYQSSESIVRKLLDEYVDIYSDDGKVNVDFGKTEVISVYSPIGRIGKTTFALTLGQILAMEKSALYINMEEFSAFEQLFQMSYPADLSDVMYYFKQYPDSLHIKLKAVVEHINGLDYIPPVIYSENLRKLKSKEWLGLINKIISFGIYDKIILDVSNMVDEPLKILESSDKIYTPVNDNQISLMKMQEFIQYLNESDCSEIQNKMIKVTMPIDKEVDESNYFESHLWGRLGDMIRQLIKGEQQYEAS